MRRMEKVWLQSYSSSSLYILQSTCMSITLIGCINTNKTEPSGTKQIEMKEKVKYTGTRVLGIRQSSVIPNLVQNIIVNSFKTYLGQCFDITACLVPGHNPYSSWPNQMGNFTFSDGQKAVKKRSSSREHRLKNLFPSTLLCFLQGSYMDTCWGTTFVMNSYLQFL